MSRIRILCPFDIAVDTIDRMLNFEIVGDAIYTGLEMQAFDQDPEYGQGVLAFLTRRDDDRAYVYRQPGLRLDPREFQVGHGVGGWTEAMLDPAHLDITRSRGCRGPRFPRRSRSPHRSQHRRPKPPPATARAPARPIRVAVENPTSLMLAYMRRFDLLRRDGREFRVLLDGHSVSTGSLPGGWLHRRRLVKYAADIVVVRLNQAQDAPIRVLDFASSRQRGAGP